MPRIDFQFLLITDRHRCENTTLPGVIEEACSAGVRAVQLREKDLSVRAVCDLAKDILPICRKYRSKLLINERFDVAAAVAADGVHLTSNSLPPEIVRQSLPRPAIIGKSTHSLAEARAAANSGCDFILFGPVFPTPSKMKYGPAQGLRKLALVSNSVEVPVIAVGGIDPEKAGQCREYGAGGVAAISSVFTAPNIVEAVREYRAALGGL